MYTQEVRFKLAKRKYNDSSRIEQVDPLKSPRDIDRVQRMLVTQGGRYEKYHKVGRRNLMLFDFGIFTGLRVSDIIKLKVKDVDSGDKFREKKTGKITRTHANQKLKRELADYIDFMGLNPDDWLFPSTRGRDHHVTRYQVYKAIHEAGLACGIPNLGSHTMRKTFGRMWYQQGRPITKLQKLFNHSSQAITLRYIGIEQEELDSELETFDPTDYSHLRRDIK